MKYCLITNKPFEKATIATQPGYILLSMFSNKLINEQHKRWILKYKKKKLFRSNVNLIQFIKDSRKKHKVNIKISYINNGNIKLLDGEIRDIKFIDMSQLKDNNNRKYYLQIYINPKNKDEFHYSSFIKNINITINTRFLTGPRFQYGYCGSLLQFKSSTLENYIQSNRPVPDTDNANPKSKCMVFDHKKGPFNSYCYTEGDVKYIN